MRETISVLVVDDHRMFADAIEMLLAGEDGIEVVGIAETGEAAVEICQRKCPSVVLMDLDLPGINGIEATKAVLKACSDARVVIVTAFQQQDVMIRAVQAGACGFVPKTRAANDLTDVIRRAAAGEIILPAGDLGVLVSGLQSAQSDRLAALRRLGGLTSREIEILQSLADGLSTSEVADRLFISPLTVQSHVKSILFKLGVHSKLEAVTFALRNALIRVTPHP
jgi:NarL family two-component system response regulator LiaR